MTLITRPQRFGKTLNLSMMECFFSVEYKNRGDLFEGLSIWNKKEYHELQGSYPVIYMSFANIKGSTFASAREGIIQSLVRLYGKYSFVRDEEFMSTQDLEYFDSVTLEMSDTTAALAISSLSDYLSRYYGRKVLILHLFSNSKFVKKARKLWKIPSQLPGNRFRINNTRMN